MVQRYKAITVYSAELEQDHKIVGPKEVKLPSDIISYTIKSVADMTGTEQKQVLLCNKYPNERTAFVAAFNTADGMIKQSTKVNPMRIIEFSATDYKGNKVKLPEVKVKVERKRVELRPGERLDKDYLYD